MQRRLVHGLHQAERPGVKCVELRDVPVVVAIARRGCDREPRPVGRPFELVDVQVGGRDLAEVAGGKVDESEALFEIGVLDFPGGGGFGDERPGRPRGVFGEEDGDGFSVGGPGRRSEKTFYAGEFLGETTGGGGDVELELTGLHGIR